MSRLGEIILVVCILSATALYAMQHVTCIDTGANPSNDLLKMKCVVR